MKARTKRAVKAALWAVLGIALVGCSRSTADWIGRLRSPESSERLHAIKALGERGGEADVVVPGLAEALHDGDAFVRRDAAGALGKIGPAARPAVPALQAALRDPNRGVRQEAARVLKRIDPEAGLSEATP